MGTSLACAAYYFDIWSLEAAGSKYTAARPVSHTDPIRSQRHLKVPSSRNRLSATEFCTDQASWEAMMLDKPELITFDVDGTLMQSTGLQANLLHKKAFSHAFLQVFGVKGTIDAIKHHGSTDPMVILNALEHYGIPQETAAPKLGELKAKMVEYAMQHVSEVGEGLEVLPGVRNLLEVLSRQDEVVIGLVTGNLEDIAWLKMEGLGIRQYFSVPNFGGYGSDHSDRGELVRIAAACADQLFRGGFRLRAHVGDTPNDIRAAEFGGALAIGVCTGIFTQKDLREATHSDTPAVILDNLLNVMNFINILGLRSRDIWRILFQLLCGLLCLSFLIIHLKYRPKINRTVDLVTTIYGG